MSGLSGCVMVCPSILFAVGLGEWESFLGLGSDRNKLLSSKLRIIISVDILDN